MSRKTKETPENKAEVQTEMFAEVAPPATNIPPTVRTYNQYGLVNGVNYFFKEDGTVDWKKMIPKKYFVINRQYEAKIQEETGKPIEEVMIEDLNERYLLVLLFGFKYLADLRGYSKIEYSRPSIGPDGGVSVGCSITWKANYETDGKEMVYTSLADATTNNTAKIGGAYYLTTIAENRAFVRAVRNGLKCEGLLGKDEIQDAKTFVPKHEQGDVVIGFKPVDSLIKKCKEKGLDKSWAKFLEIATSAKSQLSEDPSNWKSFKDISAKDIYVMTTVVNSLKL